MAGDQLPELLTIGRIGVDIYGQELGQGLEDQQTFAKAVGGSLPPTLPSQPLASATALPS